MSLVLPLHPTCRDVVELVTRYDEGDLVPDDRLRFEEHLATCGACVAYYEQLRQTSALAGGLDLDDAPLDPEVERALVAAFQAAGPKP